MLTLACSSAGTPMEGNLPCRARYSDHFVFGPATSYGFRSMEVP